MALLAAVLITMMVSALLMGVTSKVVSDNRTRFADRERTQAFYGAQAGLEQLASDLGDLFARNYSPRNSDVDAVAAMPPSMPHIDFGGGGYGSGSGFTIGYDDVNPADGSPDTEVRTIASGPYQGFVGLITQYTLSTTARTPGNAEVRLSRTIQTVGIPVFQFGIFSENDLSFHAGPNFGFGGRVHSNENIFVSSGSSGTLTLADRVTAVGEIVRTHLVNGRATSVTGHTGTVRMAKAPGCPAAPAAANSSCRNLASNEGSVTGDVGSAPNPNWTSLSLGTYNGYLRTTLTGARRLDLPLVSNGALPIDIVRRPDPLNPDAAVVAAQRYYHMASLRVLLSDTAAEILALPTVVGAPVPLEALVLPPLAGAHPLASSTGTASAGYRSPAGTPLVGGFILINKQDTAGNWTDVTNEILALGVSGRNLSNGTINTIGTCAEPFPDAIVRVQRIKDTPATFAPCGINGANVTPNSTDYWPNVVYDPREGLLRDNESTSQNELYMGGIMHYVEFDVNNYRRWLTGAIGASGGGSMDVTGYVVYFSDRRNNKNALAQETGEYGWEDFINTDSVSTPNGVLDAGEDSNGNGVLDTYGNVPQVPYAAIPSGGGTWGGGPMLDASANVWSTRVNRVVARANRAIFFRRALKLVNGGLGQIPSNGLQGLTVVSENPVYVEGNFNACGTPTQSCTSSGFGATGDAHRSAAIMADGVTLLSRNWNDLRSFNYPHSLSTASAARVGLTTWYRMAIVSGKGRPFPYPNTNPSDPSDYGSDGGAHNFLRFMENWGGATLNYRGSMVSFYFSRQSPGTYKCCQNVYSPPSRALNFDVEFLTPSLLPPRTPMFRDVNSTGFTQHTNPCGDNGPTCTP
jgi:hypothetical protein